MIFGVLALTFYLYYGKSGLLKIFEKINGNVPSNPNARRVEIFKLINSCSGKTAGFKDKEALVGLLLDSIKKFTILAPDQGGLICNLVFSIFN